MAIDQRTPFRIRFYRLAALLALVAVAGIFGATSATSASASTPVRPPRIPLKAGTSTNWSGYAYEDTIASPTPGVVNDVTGSWTVPTVDCSVVSTGYSSTWLGIDGYSSSTVEQTGTEQDCVNGAPRYSAWFEVYPKISQAISQSVVPGDQMSAEVHYTGGGLFTLMLQDTTQGWTFSTQVRENKAQRSSAEWIEEAPWSGGQVLPLADFQTVGFTSANMNGASLGSFPSTYSDAITMNDGTAIATPSTVSRSGDFSIAWSSDSGTGTGGGGTSGTLSASISYGRSGHANKDLDITVGVTDGGAPVPGAAVSITLDLNGSPYKSGSGTTGSDGTVTFVSHNAPSGCYQTFINSITSSSGTWDGTQPETSCSNE